ncbi:MAG: tetratricopeptide repeat protein [Alphaproteobacteria bacterium]|nr:tetratricopeptide repeat protein [Alphaproteobacteria bacterium]
MSEVTQRRLAAIVSADVVGYSRLIGLDEEGTLDRLRAHRAEWIDPKISEHGGRIVKTMGDGLLLEFPSVVNATRCAVDLQTGMADRNAGLGENQRIVFRIGIHLGDVVVEDGDIYGDGVNVAARLEGLADPGGICLSRAARDQVLDRLDLPLEDLGEIEVKNITRPVQVFRIALDGNVARAVKKPSTRLYRYGTATLVAVVIAFYSYDVWFSNDLADVEPAVIERMAHALPEAPSVAVLPFDNMSSDKDQDYFADGMIDDLITDLSKVSGLFVISRNPTFTYKGKSVTVQKVAEDLGVRYVAEGSVRRAGDKLRVNVQLIDALSGHHIWAERYDGAMTDVFDLQDKITAKIVAALAVKLVTGEAKATRGTGNPAAYDAVLLGWNYLRLRRTDPENYVLAHVQFEKALLLDPNYGRAHLSMAALYWWSSWDQQYVRMGVSYQEGVDRAKSYLVTAMKAPAALGHRIRAEMHRQNGQFDAAIAEAEKAIALDPNNPEGYGALASAQTHAGASAQALVNLDKADRLDPENLEPNRIRRGKAHFFLRQNEAAARYFERAVAAEPDFDWTYRWLVSAYGHLDRKVDAAAAINRMNQIRTAKGAGNFTLSFALGSTKLKRAEDRAYYRQGLEKAGLASGGDVVATKVALDTLISRTNSGGFEVKGATTIAPKRVQVLLDQGAKIFDVRGSSSWGAGHVPGALHAEKVIGVLTRDNLAKAVKPDQSVIFYCSGFT